MEAFWTEWDELLARTRNPDPLRRACWQREWLASFAPHSRPLVAGVRRGGELVAAAVLVRRNRHGIRLLAQLGHSGDLTQADFPAVDDQAGRTLVATIAELRADVLALEELDVAGPTATALSSLGLRPRMTGLESRYRLWVDEREERLRGRRKKTGRMMRKLERAGRAAETTVLSNPTDVIAQIPRVLDFHRDQWPGDLAQNRVAGPTPWRRFNERALTALAEEGRLWIAQLLVDGRTAAFHLVAFGEGSALLYNGAYDRSNRDLSGAGWASRLAAIDAVAEAGVPLVDAGPGNQDYKQIFGHRTTVATVHAPISSVGRAALRARGIRQRARGLRGRRRGDTP